MRCRFGVVKSRSLRSAAAACSRGLRPLLRRCEGQLHGMRCADFADEAVVVRDDEQRAAVVAERVGQDREAADVEVVGRLVEHEQVGHMVGEHQAAEHEPHPFAAAQRAAGFVPRRVRKQGAVEADLDFVVGQMVGVVPFGHLQHRHGGVERTVLLVEVDTREGGACHPARGRGQLAQQQPHERGLAAAVVARDMHPVSASNLQVDRPGPQRGAGRVAEIHSLGPDQLLARVEGGIVEVDFQLAAPLLTRAQLCEPLGRAVDDGGVAVAKPCGAVLCLGAAGIDQDAGLACVRFAALALCGPSLLTLAHLLRLLAGRAQGALLRLDPVGQGLLLGVAPRAVEIVVAAVAPYARGGQFAGRVQQVEQRDVVADHDQRRVRAADVIVELRSRRAVEVVGRLVEQYDLGIVEAPAREHRFRALAAAQGGGGGVGADAPQAPFVQCCAAALLDRPVVVQCLEVGRIDRARINGPQGPQFVGCAEQPGDAPTVRDGLLGDEIGVRRRDDAARRRSQPAGEKLQQRRFACAVGADQRHFGAVGHDESDVLE